MTIHAQCNHASRSALAAFRGIWFALMRCVIAVALAAANAEEATTAKPLPEQAEFFETKIRPLFANECFRCHSDEAKKLKGELHLDSRAGMLKGGETGAAVVPGNPDASLLIKAVRYKDQDTAMPPKKRLADAQIADLEAWVKMGSPWPEHEAAAVPVAPAVAEKRSYDWEKFRAEHWAFRKVVKCEPPAVNEAAWARGAIDRFILARLEAAGLKPASPAEKRTLIRRAYLDMIGLPPTPEEVAAFVADASPEAFAKVVDTLLASPHYGERWGRHWLDVARYSDGIGGSLDPEPLPEIWRYRDWVVAALNRDLPYDQFVRAQIAGDVGAEDREAGIATGFFAVGPSYITDGNTDEAVAQARAETLADRVDTFSRGFLGLTVACARCHDHKFDPITTKDYYALAGIFNNTATGLLPTVPPPVVAEFDTAQKAIQEQEKKIKDAEAAKQDAAELKAELERLRKVAPPIYQRAHMLAESGSKDMAVAIRGDLRKPGEPAPRRFLQIVAGENAPLFKEGSGRRQLADAVVDPANTLTARVIVNRVWKHHFGQALARTPSNFGVIGEKPTHPELLDWLAATFVENGWSLKKLHRMILLSATWQMSSRYDADAFAKDGENRLLWRMNPRKLEVESWRDSLLAVTGELDPALGGPPTDAIMESKRRTLYGSVSRNGDHYKSDEFLRLFDFPAPRATSEARTVSTVPQQYLFMLNSAFMTARAKALAERLARESADDRARIERAYQLLYARPPEPGETDLALAFLADTASGEPGARWQSYAQVLLSAHEFRQIQ